MMHIDDQIDDILSGEADAETVEGARAHLDVCPACYERWHAVLTMHTELLADAAIARHRARRVFDALPARNTRPRFARLPAAALFLLAVSASFLGGRLTAPAAPAPHQSGSAPPAPDNAPLREYILLLVGGDARLLPEERRADVFREFGEWTRNLEAGGSLISQGALAAGQTRIVGPQSAPLPAPVVPIDMLNGYFIVRAADQQAALQLAQSSPYLDMQGSVIVREIPRRR